MKIKYSPIMRFILLLVVFIFSVPHFLYAPSIHEYRGTRFTCTESPDKSYEKGISILDAKNGAKYDEAVLKFSCAILGFSGKKIKEKTKLAESYYYRAFLNSEMNYSGKSFEEAYKYAIKDYSEAIRLKPDYVEAFINRGMTKEDLGDYIGAIEDFTEAIKLKADDTIIYYKRANANKSLGNYMKALKDYNKIIEIDPEDTFHYLYRAKVYVELENYGKALKDYNSVIKINPTHLKAYLKRAKVKELMDDYDGAIKDYNKILEFDIDDGKKSHAQAYLRRGLIRLKLDRKNDGCLDLSKSGELGADPYQLIQKYCN